MQMGVPFRLLAATRQNMWRLCWMRVLVFALQAGCLLTVYFAGWVELAWLPLALIMLLAFNAYVMTAVRMRLQWPVTEQEFALQLGFDLLIHSALLYYSGGSTNPFVAYYLVPLTIAAATLPWLYTALLGGCALTGYTLLLIWYQPLHAGSYDSFLINLHLFGMWVNFALSAAFIAFFVSRMAIALREQEELQALRREETMRDQQLLAVATQAAGAAHELGTPLSTMSVLLGEMSQELGNNEALQADLQLLRGQVALCKDILQGLVREAEADRSQAVQWQTLDAWLAGCVDRWHLMRPEASYQFETESSGVAPLIKAPADLGQAVLNLLNNAADACAEGLQISLYWDDQQVRIRIKDSGPGVPLHIVEQLGRPFITTKGKGLGLGMFLSQASVTRAGGRVKLYNHQTGGTLAELCLPRQSALFQQGNTDD